MNQTRNGNNMSCCPSSCNPSLISPHSRFFLPTLPGMPSSTPESSVAGQKLSQGCKTPPKKILTCKQMGSSSVHKGPGRQTHPHPRRTFCVCMYVFCTVGQKYKLKVSAGAGRNQKRGLGAIKMHHAQQIRMQSLHAATKPDKTHTNMSEMQGKHTTEVRT